jgi:WXG100 family type VII secretion target
MSNMMGMDIEAVRQVAQQLQAQADEIENVITAIDQQIQTAGDNWNGTDADNFQAEWTGTNKPNLAQVATAVRELGQKADQQASEQESTSAQ